MVRNEVMHTVNVRFDKLNVRFDKIEKMLKSVGSSRGSGGKHK